MAVTMSHASTSTSRHLPRAGHRTASMQPKHPQFTTHPRSSSRQDRAFNISSLVFPPQPDEAAYATFRSRCLPDPPPDDDDGFAPTLRYSGSSAATQPDTPPRTPTSSTSITIVTAPVADVVTMDALVDGMNRFDGEDPFSTPTLRRHEQKTRRKSTSSSVHKFSVKQPLPAQPTSVQPSQVPSPSRIPRPKRKMHTNDRGIIDRPTHTQSSQMDPKHSNHESEHPKSKSHSHTSMHTPKSRGSTSSSTPPGNQKASERVPKAIIPSISEIIRTHAPNSRKDPMRSLPEHDLDDFVSRSSIDTIAEEVQRTLQHPIPDNIRSYNWQNDLLHSQSVDSPRPSTAVASSRSPSSNLPLDGYDYKPGPVTQVESIATYLRSSRLTTLIKLPRTLQTPLQVSLSDLGDPNGRPLLVFLGLGSVRYLMGLYDEMAEILGLRLITIDRWGLGRTSDESPSLRGVKEWGRVVADILQRMGVEHCSVMAHSAGAPYALAFASLRPEMVKGDICLLAPWVGGGENANYKWLKYVPNGLLKTAQAAEWRMQTWMLGKPPTVQYQGIGNDPDKINVSPAHSSVGGAGSPQLLDHRDSFDTKSRQGSFRSSDYDDLADFEGRFESRSTLVSVGGARCRATSDDSPIDGAGRRSGRGLFSGLLNRSASASTSKKDGYSQERGPKLKTLRSIGSLKGSSKSGVAPSIASRATTVQPALPPIGLGFSDFEWPNLQPLAHGSDSGACNTENIGHRSRRSISLTARPSQMSTLTQRSNTSQSTPPSQVAPVQTNGKTSALGTVGYQAALANALIAASHAESSKGVHSDLMLILNREGKSWGYTYSSYPHRVRVWYGDRDERIAESTVRWMEKSMPPQRCEVNVIKGADHSLMYRSGVVVEVLETVRSFWS